MAFSGVSRVVRRHCENLIRTRVTSIGTGHGPGGGLVASPGLVKGQAQGPEPGGLHGSYGETAGSVSRSMVISTWLG